jgi:hypothetical protein
MRNMAPIAASNQMGLSLKAKEDLEPNMAKHL